MRKAIGLVLAVMIVGMTGCAQKTESEKLADQLKKAGNQMERDAKRAADELKQEMDNV